MTSLLRAEVSWPWRSRRSTITRSGWRGARRAAMARPTTPPPMTVRPVSGIGPRIVAPPSSLRHAGPRVSSPHSVQEGSMMRKLIVAAAILLGTAAPTFAQFDTASVLGTVEDRSGGVVPGATVTLLSLDTGISATRVSDEKGTYEFTSVRIGAYKVSAELSGFAT